jgi:hypothetical protein
MDCYGGWYANEGFAEERDRGREGEREREELRPHGTPLEVGVHSLDPLIPLTLSDEHMRSRRRLQRIDEVFP